MSSILNIYYRETLDKIDSYQEYISEVKKVEDKMWWGKATNQNTKIAYEKYLNSYLNGIYSFEAREKIDEFIAVNREKELEKELIKKDFEKLIEWADEKNILEEKLPRDIDKLSKLKKLSLHNSNLNSLPNEIKVLKNITEIHLSRNYFTEVPKVLEKFDKLTWISIINSGVKEIPNFFRKYKKLKGLFFYGTQIKKLPEWIGEFTELEYLSLSGWINEFPDTFYNLKKLYELEISGSGKNLSSAITNFKNLEILRIGDSDTLEFPKYLSELNLRALELRISSEVKEFPKFIKKLTNLERLKIFGGNIKKIPDWIVELESLKELKIHFYKIDDFHILEKIVKYLKFLNEETKAEINSKIKNLKEDDNHEWNIAIEENDLQFYKRYLQRYPNGLYKQEVLEKINYFEDEDVCYQNAKEKNDIPLYKKYLEQYPYPIGRYSLEILSKQLTPIILTWFENNGLEKEYQYKDFNDFCNYPNGYSINSFWLSYIKDKKIYLPEELKYYKMIKKIKLDEVSIDEIPYWIGELTNLEEIYINKTKISSLPDSMKNLKNLKSVTLESSYFNKIPLLIGQLKNLEEFKFSLSYDYTEITILPENLKNLKNLKKFSTGHSKLENIPDWIGEFYLLEDFYIKYNDEFVKKLPESFKNLKNLKSFPWSAQWLEDFPQLWQWIGQGHFPNLESISFPDSITELPNEIKKLKKLKSLSNGYRDGKLKKIPDWIDELENLKYLKLICSDIKEIPEQVGNLTKLEDLILCTSAKEIPSTFCNLKNLKDFNCGYYSPCIKRFRKIPKCFLELPNLEDSYDCKDEFKTVIASIEREKDIYKNKVQVYNTKKAYQMYLKRYPDGIYIKEAKKKIEQLPNSSILEKMSTWNSLRDVL